MNYEFPLDEQGLPQDYNFRPHWEVTPRQVKAWLDERRDFLLLDCRRPEERDICKVEPSLFTPILQLDSLLPDLEQYKDRKLVIVCHRGRRSFQMTAILRELGYSDVMSMAGGLDVWAMDVDTTMPRY